MDNEINVLDTPVCQGKPTLGDKLLSVWRKFKRGFSNSLREKNYCYLSFAIPVIIIYITFIVMGMWPFGNKAILTLDMDGQYIYFFEQLRDVYTGKESLFYTFERCLGGEFLGYFTYYLASPISFLVVLFPETMITEAVMSMMILKSGLAGLTFSIYLGRTRQKNTVGFTMFSVMYALCSYATMYQFNVMWMDALIWLPLITLGIESLVKDGRFLLFVISLAMAICSNYYIGYMLCIYVALYFFFFIASKPYDELNGMNESYHRLKSLVRIGVASVIALMIAMAIILSAYYSLQLGKTSYQDNAFDPDLRFDILHLMAKMFVGSFDTVRLEGTPNVYAGTLMLIMLPVFYMSKRIKSREKALYTALALIFIISFSLNTIDLVWHGFQIPVWFNYRYSFMFSFILLCMAYRGYEEIDEVSTGFLGKTGALLILLVVIIQKTVVLTRYEYIDGAWTALSVKPGIGMAWLTILLVLAYLAVFLVKKHTDLKRTATIFLSIIVFVEAFANSAINWAGELKDGGCATRDNYRDYAVKLETAVNEVYSKDSSFFRMEHLFYRKQNDNMLGNVNGMSEFTSTFNASTVNFMKKLGFFTSDPTIKYVSGNPVADALLGVKYVIGTSEEDTNGNLPGLSSVYSGYSSVTTESGFVIYENPYVLPIAYRVEKNINKLFDEHQFYGGDKSPFATLNHIMSSMLGRDTYAFETCHYTTSKGSLSGIDYDDNGGISFRRGSGSDSSYFYFTVQAAHDGNIYMYLPSPYTTAATLKVNGKSIFTNMFQGETKRIIDLGSYKKGEVVRVELSFSHYRLYLWDTKDYFVQINEAVLKEATDTLKAGGLQIEEYSDTSFTGTLNAIRDGAVFTSIPYDSNWRVYVDGERVETYEMIDAMLGFDVSAGEHQIELVYVHTPFIAGVIISLVGIGLLVAWSILDAKWRKKRVIAIATESELDSLDTEATKEELHDSAHTQNNDDLSEENNDIPS